MATENHRSGVPQTHPLGDLPALTQEQIQALRQRWINTVEELVGAAAVPAATGPLAQLIQVSAEQLQDLLHQAQDLLGEERYGQLVRPVPKKPTGALLTEEQKRDLGLQ